MHDGQIPDINLDELMEKIRTEVSRRKTGANPASSGLPDVSLVDRPIYNSSAGKWPQVENALSMAEQVSQVGTRLPGMHTFQGWISAILSYRGFILWMMARDALGSLGDFVYQGILPQVSVA